MLNAVIVDQARALDFTQTSYRVGRIDLRNVEQQQTSLDTARMQLLRVRAEQLSQRVALASLARRQLRRTRASHRKRIE